MGPRMKRTRRRDADFWYSAADVGDDDDDEEDTPRGDGRSWPSSFLLGGDEPLEGDSCDVTIRRCMDVTVLYVLLQ